MLVNMVQNKSLFGETSWFLYLCYTQDDHVRNVGILIDLVTKTAFYRLIDKQESRIWCPKIPERHFMLNAFNSSRMNYSNGNWTSHSKNTIKQQQLIQNADAWVLLLLLKSLHWLPFSSRIGFKVLLTSKINVVKQRLAVTLHASGTNCQKMLVVPQMWEIQIKVKNIYFSMCLRLSSKASQVYDSSQICDTSQKLWAHHPEPAFLMVTGWWTVFLERLVQCIIH